MMNSFRNAALGFACLGCLATADADAATYGLVIGIDRYDTQDNLFGAVNDARDIAEALRDFGAQDVQVFPNEQATRDRIERAWQGLLKRAAPGDTIVLTVSAHGAQEDDLDGDEATRDQPNDKQDEVILLGAFDPNDPIKVRERLLDDDLYQWFLAAKERGVRVLFVADTCYSGGATRSMKPQSARTGNYYSLPKPPRQERKPRDPGEQSDVPSNVFFISGGREAELVLEVMIDGAMRGATSHAFARAVEGAADRNGDGIFTRDEMARYVDTIARQGADAKYSPDFKPRGGADFPVLVKARPGTAPVLPVLAPTLQPPQMPGQLLDTGGNDVFWDSATNKLLSRDGEILGLAVESWMLSVMTDKFRLIELIKKGARRNPVNVEIRERGRRSDKLHQNADKLSLAVGPIPAPYVTVFNLTNEGWVQPVYPQFVGEEDAQAIGRELRPFEVLVTPPFGADHVVAVVTDTPPTQLRKALERGPIEPSKLYPLVKQLIDTARPGLGLHAFFTREAAR